MTKILLVLAAAPVFATAYLPEDFESDLAVTREQLRSYHGIHEAVVGSLRALGRTDEQILRVLDYIMEHPGQFPSGSESNAAGCFGLLQSTNAISRLETLIDSSNWNIRAAATLAYRDRMFNSEWADASTVARLEQTANRPLVHGTEIRHWIYYGFDNELRNAGPNPTRQRLILQFLLAQATIDSKDGSFLDEILCREVPKWRASPQRAENAAKMIREHPDDARLVAFFETVRTNALESARTALPSENANDDPATTNQSTRTSSSSAVAISPADSGPWADLLDDLPKKKPWTPPPGYEPPF